MTDRRASDERWTDGSYAELERVLRARSGLIFSSLRRGALEAAATRVMRRIGIGAQASLVDLVRADGAVFDDLMAEVTVGETYFFREPAQFELLRKRILPEFRERRSGSQPIRVWSAACATGEEPYSIALVLREESTPGIVVGTDISRARLAAARRGEYREWSFRGVSRETLSRYFTRTSEGFFSLNGLIRRDVEFRYLNLAADLYPSMGAGVWGMDVILCRNVLIYFDKDTIRHVAKALLDTLSEKGWLLVGATDPRLDEYVKCAVVQTDAGLAYRHGGATIFAAPERTRAPSPEYAEPIEFVVPSPPAPPLVPAVETVPTSGMSHATADTSVPLDNESAASAYGRRDYERVAEFLAANGSDATASVADSVMYVRALANLGRLSDAGRACAAALERHRASAELHYLHAVLVSQAGQAEESARAAKRAIYLDSSMIVARLALGSALSSTGDSAGALRAFQAAERLLLALGPDELVQATDGEPAGRLLEMTRLQMRLASSEAAA
ncbi:MAG: protein-glutamate O-methyltransferase CheR [Gemmatimonadaceae bacterium]